MRPATAWSDYLAGVTTTGLTDSVAYTNLQGEDWVKNTQDLLMHVVFPSSYHRGQIATLFGRAGHESAYTDFIHCVRQQI
ncbi:MAG: hypothetical protein H8E66_21015 [Planctomycetes bacterium]|nr:hypothetical protein [Planctomycetota bacterium]